VWNPNKSIGNAAIRTAAVKWSESVMVDGDGVVVVEVRVEAGKSGSFREGESMMVYGWKK
jgi:hypothetical protein